MKHSKNRVKLQASVGAPQGIGGANLEEFNAFALERKSAKKELLSDE